MNATPIQTKNLRLVLQTREDVRAQIEQMQPHEKAELSAAWLALLEGSISADPWIHGFVLVHQASGGVVGRCGFKGPPGGDGVVEIAYGVAPEHQGKGYGLNQSFGKCMGVSSFWGSLDSLLGLKDQAHITLETKINNSAPSTRVIGAYGLGSIR